MTNTNIHDSITSARLRQLCDFNVAYNGYVDDGNGTSLLISNMRIDENTTHNDGYAYYEKTVSIEITEAVHTVRKGDTLWDIAIRYGVTVQEIVQDNDIKNPDLIYPGEVLKIRTSIKYGYHVNCMIDLLSFYGKGRDGHKPISESALFEGIDYVTSAAEALAASLAKSAGKSTIGNNGRIYWEKAGKRIFYGNQYVRTSNLSNFIKPVKAGTTVIAALIETVEIFSGYEQDGRNFDHNARKQMVGTVGSVAGAVAGGYLGEKAGTTLGLRVALIGAIPGAVIGRFVGGLLGGVLGEMGAEAAYETFIQK